MTTATPHENLKWYAITPEGEPICEVCGAVGETVEVIAQTVLGESPHDAVTGQTYLFTPCGHQNVVDLPDPTGM
jgi:hypothetical protein